MSKLSYRKYRSSHRGRGFPGRGLYRIDEQEHVEGCVEGLLQGVVVTSSIAESVLFDARWREGANLRSLLIGPEGDFCVEEAQIVEPSDPTSRFVDVLS